MAIATDDFNRGDGDPGSNWSLNETDATKPVISSNQLVHNGGTANNQIIQWNVFSPSNNQFARAKVVTLDDMWLIVRGQSPSTTLNCYGMNIYSGTADFFKWVSSTPTQIGSSISDTISGGDIVEVHISGYTLYYFRNGVLKGSETDGTSQYASGYVGIGTYGTSSIWDDWVGGDSYILNVKTIDGLGKLYIKTASGLSIESVKSIDGLT